MEKNINWNYQNFRGLVQKEMFLNGEVVAKVLAYGENVEARMTPANKIKKFDSITEAMSWCEGQVDKNGDQK